MTLRARVIEIVPYDERWPERFAQLAAELRREVGDVAVRIDHKGSTAVPGLAGKPVIDIQMSVPSLEPADAYEPALARLGWTTAGHPHDRSKRLYTRPVGEPALLHVRPAGSLGEQLHLLFRDYLRTHPEAAEHYAAVKKNLAAGRSWADVDEYANAKSTVVWALLHEAYLWSMETGWAPGPSDA